NTLITDAILTSDPTELSAKARLYEQAMRAIYEAYVPSFAVSYDALGDQEAFALKYAWELTIYFAFFVFPFINDLFTERRFLHLLLGKLSRLGRLNAGLHTFLSAFYQWKKRDGQPPREPVFFDFTEIGPLQAAERAFYRIGVSVEEAGRILDAQLSNVKELARFLVAYIYSVVLDDEQVVTKGAFVESIDLG